MVLQSDINQAEPLSAAPMSTYARVIGLIVAVAMGAFSAYIFLKTGDWVAAVFFIGSVAYAVVFVSTHVAIKPSDIR